MKNESYCRPVAYYFGNIMPRRYRYTRAAFQMACIGHAISYGTLYINGVRIAVIDSVPPELSSIVNMPLPIKLLKDLSDLRVEEPIQKRNNQHWRTRKNQRKPW